MSAKEAIYKVTDRTFELREFDPEELPSPYHAKIKIKWVGICGSDLHSLETNFLPELALGHEWVGEVTAVGNKVKDFSPGDAVTSTVQIRCGYCPSCIQKRDGCDNQFSLAVNNGMLREVAFLPARSLVKIPKPLKASSTLFEILAVAENVFTQVSDQLDKSEKILILGAGLLGLSCGLVLQREGYQVLLLETIPSRVSRAHKIGLECRHLGEALMDQTLNDSFNTIVDATGDHLKSKGGWKYLEHFGKKQFLGVILAKYLEPIQFRTDRFFSKQANLKWIQGCTEDSLLRAVQKWTQEIDELGKILITHQFNLEKVNDAFAQAGRRDEAGRVIISVSS